MRVVWIQPWTRAEEVARVEEVARAEEVARVIGEAYPTPDLPDSLQLCWLRILERNTGTDRVSMINFVFPTVGNRKHPHHDEGEEEATGDGEVSLKPAFKTLVLRVLIIVIYMCLGALVFCAIEYRFKDTTIWKRKTRLIKSRLVIKYNVSVQELERFEQAIEKRMLERKEEHKEWNYYQSLYFASTVTTTIGMYLTRVCSFPCSSSFKRKSEFSFVVWRCFFFMLLSHTSMPVSSIGFIDGSLSSSSICVSSLLLWHFPSYYLLGPNKSQTIVFINSPKRECCRRT